MASVESQKLIALLESLKAKEAMRRQFETGERNDAVDSPEPLPEAMDKLAVVKTRFHDANLFRLSPEDGAGKTHVLYFHGGGYVSTFSKYHWQFLGRLVRRMKCTLTTPDYPLAPEHPYPAAYNLAEDLYRDTISTTDPDTLILMGDSAGAGLCLAVAQTMREEKVSLPREIVLLSPWLDITMSHPDIKAIDAVDPFLSVEGCLEAGKMYAGANDPTHFLISPINGTFHGLPRISIFTGSRDILIPDARRLATMLEAQKIDFVYEEFEEMIHVWMLFDIPESDQVIEKISQLA